ncbi:MAG: hypothetical protein ACREQW_04960 [Candidatus Binatia bacterium]
MKLTQWIDALVHWVAALPDFYKAALLASIPAFITAGAAIVSVYLTNRRHEQRLARQLKAEHEERKVEREMALRKQIFLDATEALVAGLSGLNKHADLGLTREQLYEGFADKRAAIAKVHLIGCADTVKAVLAFQNELTLATSRLTLQREVLLKMQNRLKGLEEQIHQSIAVRSKWVEIAEDLAKTANTDDERWKFINTRFEDEQKKIDGAFAQHDAIGEKFQADWLNFSAACIQESTHVSRFLIPAVAAVRSELGLPLDMELYRKSFEENLETQQQVIRDFLARANDELFAKGQELEQRDS